jgi:hypothetical protein
MSRGSGLLGHPKENLAEKMREGKKRGRTADMRGLSLKL